MLSQRQNKRSGQNRFIYYLLILFVSLPVILSAQPFVLDSGFILTKSPGNDMFPKWSPDGKKIVYQSDRNGSRDIYVYDLETDTSVQLTSSPENEQHPVWFAQGRKVAFDCDYGDGLRLYVLDIKTKEIKLLFDRNIQARQPAFASHDDLVFFSGFDEEEKIWKIYSYEFYYQNLNELYGNTGTCTFPAVSPKGDRIIFLFTGRGDYNSQMMTVNWYGNVINRFDESGFLDPSFAANGNLIYFVSKKDNLQGEVYSMHKDGTHMERLTDDKYIVRCPRVSPDGSKIVVSVKTGNNFDIYIVPLDDY